MRGSASSSKDSSRRIGCWSFRACDNPVKKGRKSPRYTILYGVYVCCDGLRFSVGGRMMTTTCLNDNLIRKVVIVGLFILPTRHHLTTTRRDCVLVIMQQPTTQGPIIDLYDEVGGTASFGGIKTTHQAVYLPMQLCFLGFVSSHVALELREGSLISTTFPRFYEVSKARITIHRVRKCVLS